MFIKYFYDERLAQASYMVGCSESHTAIVIDPARDILPYLDMAKRQSVNIDFVTETHIHADFVSGVRELAAATDAKILLSAMGGQDWEYAYPDDNISLLRDGTIFHVGTVKMETLYTPGHTPEHLAFMITDTKSADQPIGIFTGDFLFVGDIGRPDLLETAVNIADTAEPGARQQFANIQRFKKMSDYLQIWPGHGAGSVCGKALGAMPSTTLGYEKLFNPAFQFDDEDAFVKWLLSDQPETPRYFARMKQVNQEGAALLRELPQAQHITESPDGIVPEHALFIDTRPESDFAHRHIPGTINIPIISSNFNTYVGWYVDYATPVFFIAYRADVQDVLNQLFAIGVEDVRAYFTSEIVRDADGRVNMISPQEAHRKKLPILDVRGANEYRDEHIPGAQNVPMGYVLEQIHDIPRDTPLVIHCGSGTRSQLVISLLQKNGFTNLLNLAGGIDAWKEVGLPLESGD